MKWRYISLFPKDLGLPNVNNIMTRKIETATAKNKGQTEISAIPIKQSVLIAIPTFRRSARLQALLPHISKTLKSVHAVEILVIDNNALPTEQKFVQNFSKTSIYPIHYIHEPKAGVSNCLLYTSPSPRDLSTSRMPSSA